MSQGDCLEIRIHRILIHNIKQKYNSKGKNKTYNIRYKIKWYIWKNIFHIYKRYKYIININKFK